MSVPFLVNLLLALLISSSFPEFSSLGISTVLVLSTVLGLPMSLFFLVSLVLLYFE